MNELLKAKAGFRARVNKRNIFVVDGIGALMTALSLGVALPFFKDVIGLPVSTFYLLSAIAIGFCIYSFSCYLWADTRKALFLKIIMSANLGYCLVTAIVMWQNWNSLKPLGVLYFVGEIFVVLTVVFVEFRVLQNLVGNQKRA